ncbi:MAG: PKD domain-containing protein [Bacteroidia bacterium]
MRKLILICSLLCSIFACDLDNKGDLITPAPDFKVNNDSCKAPCDVAFLNLTKDQGFSYFWNFGNGFSNETSPIHRFEQGGIYNVKLRASHKQTNAEKEKAVYIDYNYTKCRIKAVSLVSSNKIDNSWDNGTDGPDLFIKITDEIGTIYAHNNYVSYQNIQASQLPLSMTDLFPDVSEGITNLDKTYKVQLYDYDAFMPETLMTSVEFVPKNYPYAFHQNASQCTISNADYTFVVTLEWANF